LIAPAAGDRFEAGLAFGVPVGASDSGTTGVSFTRIEQYQNRGAIPPANKEVDLFDFAQDKLAPVDRSVKSITAAHPSAPVWRQFFRSVDCDATNPKPRPV
jgi:hypothetical protein